MVFKFNNGNGAVLCSKCRKILMSGSEIPQYIWVAVRKGLTASLPDMYCDDCAKCNNSVNIKDHEDTVE